MRTAAGTKEKKRMIGTGFNKPFSGKQDRLEGAHKPWSGPEGGKCKEWDISSVMPDLCELCAIKIDLAVAKIRAEFGGNNA